MLRETQVRSLGREDPVEKEMATHSVFVPGKNPMDRGAWGLQSMGSQRVGTQLSDFTNLSDHLWIACPRTVPTTQAQGVPGVFSLFMKSSIHPFYSISKRLNAYYT